MTNAAAAKLPNPWIAVLRVFESPTLVFDQMAERPAILPPYLVSTLLGGIATALSLPITVKLMADEWARQGLQQQPAMEFMQSWSVVAGVIGAAIGPWITGLFVAGIVFGLVWIRGQTTTFKAVFSAIGYARLPVSVGTLITALLLTRVTTIDQLRHTTLTAAVLAPAGTSPLLIGALSTIAPFGLWYLGLTVIAVASLTRSSLAKSWWPAVVLFGMNLLFGMLGNGFSTTTTFQ